MHETLSSLLFGGDTDCESSAFLRSGRSNSAAPETSGLVGRVEIRILTWRNGQCPEMC